jgi:hypothetical protein
MSMGNVRLAISPVMLGLLPVKLTSELFRTRTISLRPSNLISAEPSVMMLSKSSPSICMPLALSILNAAGDVMRIDARRFSNSSLLLPQVMRTGRVPYASQTKQRTMRPLPVPGIELRMTSIGAVLRKGRSNAVKIAPSMIALPALLSSNLYSANGSNRIRADATASACDGLSASSRIGVLS